jgi:hypothetical protein
MFLVGVVAMLVLSTGLGWNVGGVGAVGDLVTSWLSRTGADAGLSVIGILLLYEPLALVLGIGGVAWAMQRGRRLGLFMGAWVALGALALILVPSPSPTDAVWIVLPLALLGGGFAESVIRTSRQRPVWRRLWPYALLTFALWVYFYLRMTRYALYADSNDLVLSILAFIFPLVLLLLVSLLFAFTAGQEDQQVLQEIVGGSRTVLHGAVVGSLIALIASTISSAWGVAHVRPTDPSELLVSAPTSPQIHILRDTLHDISWRETSTRAMLPFAYSAPSDAVLAWYLRDFPMARRVDTRVTAALAPVVITLRREEGALSGEGAGLTWQDQGDAFRGQDFVLVTDWDPQTAMCYWERDPETERIKWPPRCESAARWLFLRQSPKVTYPVEWAELWIR